MDLKVADSVVFKDHMGNTWEGKVIRVREHTIRVQANDESFVIDAPTWFFETLNNRNKTQ